MDAFRLDDRVAFVTGAGSERGIGRAIAAAYARAGAQVGLADLDEAGVQAGADAVRAAGGSATGVRADVTEPDSVASAVAHVERELGPIDILVNSAGIVHGAPIQESSLADFDRVMAVNVRGGLICLQAVLPGMMTRRRGRIIWLSSVAGKQGGGFFGSSHYAASKAAVIGLCQGIARELGPHGITSNAIAPGLILTGLVARSGGQEIENQLRERTEASVPVRRVGTPEDIAHAALFLATDAAGYVTGEILDVNGGAYFD